MWLEALFKSSQSVSSHKKKKISSERQLCGGGCFVGGRGQRSGYRDQFGDRRIDDTGPRLQET